MIKNYNQFNESLRDKLVGPTEDEVIDIFLKKSPQELLRKSCKLGLLKGVKIAIENGADIHADNDSALIHSSNYGNLNIVKLLL